MVKGWWAIQVDYILYNYLVCIMLTYIPYTVDYKY